MIQPAQVATKTRITKIEMSFKYILFSFSFSFSFINYSFFYLKWCVNFCTAWLKRSCHFFKNSYGLIQLLIETPLFRAFRLSKTLSAITIYSINCMGTAPSSRAALFDRDDTTSMTQTNISVNISSSDCFSHKNTHLLYT